MKQRTLLLSPLLILIWAAPAFGQVSHSLVEEANELAEIEVVGEEFEAEEVADFDRVLLEGLHAVDPPVFRESGEREGTSIGPGGLDPFWTTLGIAFFAGLLVFIVLS